MIFIIVSGHSAVYANETLANNYGISASPATIDEYSRLGSYQKITVTSSLSDVVMCSDPDVECINFVPSTADVTLKCAGSSANGGWTISNTNGQCWNSLDYCYGYGTPAEVCFILPASLLTQVLFKPYSKCTVPDPDKNFCIHDYNGTIGIEANTGDDMFRINQGAEAFFEYLNMGGIDNSYRLKWIERNTVGSSLGLMMPSGPPGVYSDYEQFVDNNPAFVNIQKACFPTETSICTGVGSPLPPVEGVCATDFSDDNTLDPKGNPIKISTYPLYSSLADIPADGFCYIGNPINKAETNDNITWNCSGINGGPDSPQCLIPKSIDGICGTAHQKEYTDLSADLLYSFTNSELCSSGTAVIDRTTGDVGSWSWGCNSSGYGKSARCFITQDIPKCKELKKANIAMTQDVSGSFTDDIDNISTGLETLIDYPIFQQWGIGITRFNNEIPNEYQKVLDFKNVASDKTQIINTIEGHRAYANWGPSENAFLGIINTINDFKGQVPNNETMTLVVITDEGPTGYHHADWTLLTPVEIAAYEAEALKAIADNNINFIALTTANLTARNQAKSYYQSFAQKAGGIQVTIAKDSSNFASALLKGMIEVNCD